MRKPTPVFLSILAIIESNRVIVATQGGVRLCTLPKGNVLFVHANYEAGY